MSFLVLGAGAWGTAFAMHLARFHPTVYLWSKHKDHAKQMQKAHQNERYLPHIFFPPSLQVIENFEPFLKFVHAIIIAVPSHAFRETVSALACRFLIEKHTLFWITKGLDGYTHDFLDETAKTLLGDKLLCGVLSGPSFARETALEYPTAVTLAGHDKAWVSLFHTPRFRVYFSDDMKGVQLGGAIKNVFAIAAGMAEGLQCGANAQAALITRSLAEMLRLGKACGARQETLMGLSGMGDLVLTATHDQSRNRRFGKALATLHTQEAAQKTIEGVVEGITAAKEIYHLSRRYEVDMPIVEQIYSVLYEDLPLKKAMENLLERPPRTEF